MKHERDKEEKLRARKMQFDSKIFTEQIIFHTGRERERNVILRKRKKENVILRKRKKENVILRNRERERNVILREVSNLGFCVGVSVS